MVDYSKSFGRGLDKAKLSEKNRQEISSVFEELNRQLDAASEGKIMVQREQFDEADNSNPFLAITLAPRKKYWALSARHKIDKKLHPYELARWGQDPNGYPCKIYSSGAESFCENREALEQSLDQLLQEPDIGSIFLKLISHKPNLESK